MEYLCADHPEDKLISLCIDKTCKEKNRNCCGKCTTLKNKHNKHDAIEYTEASKIIEKHYNEDTKQEQLVSDLNKKAYAEVDDKIAKLIQQYASYANQVAETMKQKLTQKFNPNQLVRKYYQQHPMSYQLQDIDSLSDLFMADKLEYPNASIEPLIGQINQFMERLNQIRDVTIKSTIDAGLYPKPQPVVQPQPQPQPQQQQQVHQQQVHQQQNQRPNQPVNQPPQQQQQQPQGQQTQSQLNPKPKPQEEEKKQQTIAEKMAADLRDLDKTDKDYGKITKKWTQVYETLKQKGANEGRGFCGKETNYQQLYGGGLYLLYGGGLLGGYCGTSHGVKAEDNWKYGFYCCEKCWEEGEGKVNK